jgi:hypothetical protein
MTGWAADRHITPRVMAHLRDHLPDVPVDHRPSIAGAGLVLHALARWARREPDAEHSGLWLTDETVGQIAASTALPPGTIRDALGALEHVGLVVTLRRGGGTGTAARGATRRLVLDPVDNGATARGNPAEFRATARGDRATARGDGATARGTPRHRVPRSLRVPRAGVAGEAFTAPPSDEADRARATYANYADGVRRMGAEPLSPRAYWLEHAADAPDVWADR